MKNNLLRLLKMVSYYSLIGICMQIVFINLVFAANTVAQIKSLQEVEINIQLNEANLETVFEAIEEKTNFKFTFDQKDLDPKVKITYQGTGVSLKDVLIAVSKEAYLSFRQLNNNIDVVRLSKKDLKKKVKWEKFVQQNITVTGKVTSEETPEGLPGVNVIVKGTTLGTVTDVNGNYQIDVPSGESVLVFSSIGFVSEEVAVGGKSVIDMALVPDIKSLDEIVVIGYGNQKKEDLTGAVSSANLEPFKESPNVNIAQSLQGTIPGLNVGQVNSAGTTPDLSIRGQTSLGGSGNVLVVVDGIMYTGSITALDPNDIESIDVLKDASSAAVYGAQGANGVILITTKKGKRGRKPSVTYSASYTTQTPSENLRPLNREQFIQKIRDLYYDEAYLAPDYTTPDPNFNPAVHMDGSVLDDDGNILPTDFDWWDAATKTGSIMEHKLSISGGSAHSSYLLSAGYTRQEGYIINDFYERKSIRLNMDTDIKDWWTIGVQSFATFGDYSGQEPTMSGIVRHAPMLTPFDEDGELIPFPTGTILPNPFRTYYVDDFSKQNYLFGNFYSDISFPFLEGLSYRINYGNTYRWDRNYRSSEYAAGLTGEAFKNHDYRYDYTLDNILTFKRNINVRHNITATLLYGATERKYDYTSSTGTDFSSLTLGYNSLQQATNQFANSSAWSETLNYYMGRLNYNYDGRYLLTATFRRDGFSGFAANKKWGSFPSAAVGWVISKENFFQGVDFVNFLKLRAGYGSIGNLTERYFSLARISREDAYVFGDGGSTVFGQWVSSLANPDLEWEATVGFNLGLTFNLFNNRLDGSIEYYNTETKNQLFERSIPTITGVGSVNLNLGEIGNRGVELSLNSVNINRADFRWESTLVFARNTNEIISLTGEDLDEDGVEDDIIADERFIGEPIGVIFGFEPGAIYQLDDEIPEGYYPGTARVIDQDGDGEITPDDRTIIGYIDPAFRASLLNTVTYKNFSLTVFLNTIQGGKDRYMQSNNPTIGSERNNNSIELNYFRQIDFWSPSNPGARFPRTTTRATVTPGVYQQRSFVRLQDISLTYKFSPAVLEKIGGLQGLSLFVSGKNLATWTEWDGWDPETGQGFTDNGRPVMKGYSFGLNVTF